MGCSNQLRRETKMNANTNGVAPTTDLESLPEISMEQVCGGASPVMNEILKLHRRGTPLGIAANQATFVFGRMGEMYGMHAPGF